MIRARWLAIAALPMLMDAADLLHANGFTWIKSEEPAYVLYYEPGTEAERDLESIKRRINIGRARAEQLLGRLPDAKVDGFLASSRARVKDLIGYESNGVAIDGAALMTYGSGIDAVGAHEFFHVWSGRLWGPPKGRWANEGFAVYADDRWYGIPLHTVAKVLLDRGKLLPLRDLTGKSWNAAHSDMVTYPQAGSFVKFVYETYGREALKRLWQRGSGDARKATGKSLPDLEKEWLAQLRQIDAAVVAYPY